MTEVIVYLTVWLALVCFPAAAVGRATEDRQLGRWARRVWSFGCLLFGLHVVSAFGVFYQWSHAFALAETARQTFEATGFESGSGLYLNYLFALLWLIETVWWWWRPVSYRRRSLGIFLAVQGFFLFMIVNGAVIFVDGPRRWLGVVVTTMAVIALGVALRRERTPRREKTLRREQGRSV
ncbi:MAG: hypothetical protein AAGD38_09575 [Acidobacteriota bacterium]